MKRSKILSPVDQWRRQVEKRVWHLVMWGGVAVMMLSMAVLDVPVPEAIIISFVFLGVWAFVSDPITEKIVHGSTKQSDADGIRR